MSTDLNLNQRQATEQLLHRGDTEMQNVLEREAVPARARSALPRSVCLFRHVPCPGDEVLAQIGDNGFSTEHLWAEDVGQYTFIVVEVDSEKLSLKRHEERPMKTSRDCPVMYNCRRRVPVHPALLTGRRGPGCARGRNNRFPGKWSVHPSKSVMLLTILFWIRYILRTRKKQHLNAKSKTLLTTLKSEPFRHVFW